jgi:hypothetical protein
MWTAEAWYGGASDQSIAADYTIKDRHIRVWSFTATGAGLSVLLPSALLLRTGFGLFFITNRGATHAIAIKNAGGTLILSLATGASVILSLRTNTTANGVWIAKQ